MSHFEDPEFTPKFVASGSRHDAIAQALGGDPEFTSKFAVSTWRHNAMAQMLGEHLPEFVTGIERWGGDETARPEEAALFTDVRFVLASETNPTQIISVGVEVPGIGEMYEKGQYFLSHQYSAMRFRLDDGEWKPAPYAGDTYRSTLDELIKMVRNLRDELREETHGRRRRRGHRGGRSKRAAAGAVGGAGGPDSTD